LILVWAHFLVVAFFGEDADQRAEVGRRLA
jgi:hypothetical protein